MEFVRNRDNAGETRSGIYWRMEKFRNNGIESEPEQRSQTE